jgi:aminoglycoside 6'-N-acetyltransferase I
MAMTNAQFKIRAVEENDFSEWLRLRKILWDENAESEHIREMAGILEHMDTQFVLIAETPEGRIAGFLEVSIRPFVEDCHTDHVGYLEGWFVDPEFRRNGIGRELVREAEDWARRHGCTEMASDTEVGNEPSLTTHQAFGYEISSKLIHLRKDL